VAQRADAASPHPPRGLHGDRLSVPARHLSDGPAAVIFTDPLFRLGPHFFRRLSRPEGDENNRGKLPRPPLHDSFVQFHSTFIVDSIMMMTFRRHMGVDIMAAKKKAAKKKPAAKKPAKRK
jgi:hypothetical protein